MDRCAVFVDAGYLHESAKTLMLAGHHGATVRANATLLVREIAALAVAQTQLPLLRIYWYAAAPNRNPYPDQRELASLDHIKLRLGNLRERAGGRMVQKGVDAELHADMTGLARNRGAVDFVLLSGDEDLLRAVDEVQSFGVRVHLWGVEAGPDGNNQSLELIAAADRRYVLDESWIRRVFTVLEPPKPDSPMAEAGPRMIPASGTAHGPVQRPTSGELPGPAQVQPAPLEEPAGGGPAPEGVPARAVDAGDASPIAAVPQPGTSDSLEAGEPATGPLDREEPGKPQVDAAAAHAAAGADALHERPATPKPTDVRARVISPPRTPGSVMAYSVATGQAGFSPRPEYAFYRLSDLTTQAEQYQDAAEDDSFAFDAITVGRVYARRWLRRATGEAAALITSQYPTIPKAIDAELLRYAVSRGVDTWSSETDKFAVRQGFWSEIRISSEHRDLAGPVQH